MDQFNRREFLAAAAAALAAAQANARVLAEQQPDSGGLPTRPLGKTGQRVSTESELAALLDQVKEPRSF